MEVLQEFTVEPIQQEDIKENQVKLFIVLSVSLLLLETF